jgi:hypothetical protein
MRAESFRQKLANDPRFERAGESGVAYIIVGYKPPQAARRKTWYIQGTLAGVKFARASRTDIRAIRPGETFLGVPYDELEIGMEGSGNPEK